MELWFSLEECVSKEDFRAHSINFAQMALSSLPLDAERAAVFASLASTAASLSMQAEHHECGPEWGAHSGSGHRCNCPEKVKM